MKLAVILVVVVILMASLYVRLAPIDPARWHQMPNRTEAGVFPDIGGHEIVFAFPDRDAALTAVQSLDQVIRRAPRTNVLAGEVGDGLVSYVSRSAVWHFPDLTTVSVVKKGEAGLSQDTESWLVSIRGRLRFGKADLGLNRQRIEAWVADAGLSE